MKTTINAKKTKWIDIRKTPPKQWQDIYFVVDDLINANGKRVEIGYFMLPTDEIRNMYKLNKDNFNNEFNDELLGICANRLHYSVWKNKKVEVISWIPIETPKLNNLCWLGRLGRLFV